MRRNATEVSSLHRLIRQLLDGRDRWRDLSLTVLLWLQVLTIFGIVPLTAAGLPVPDGVAALLLFLGMSLTMLMAQGRWAPLAGVLMLILSSASLALHGPGHGTAALVTGNVAGLLSFALLSTVVVGAVFSSGRINRHRIRGAVVFYLNLGLLFAFAHRIVADLIPGAYSNLPPVHYESVFRAAIDYFSFSTLTSVGYGDVIPVHPIARSLSTLEAAIGQLLPTLLIARVVSMAVQGTNGASAPPSK